jgi:hypothetical protein
MLNKYKSAAVGGIRIYRRIDVCGKNIRLCPPQPKHHLISDQNSRSDVHWHTTMCHIPEIKMLILHHTGTKDPKSLVM